MAAHQAPPSLGFSRQEHWSGLPFPAPMHESEKWQWSRSVVSDSSWPHGLQPTRLRHPWDFPGKSTGVGCHYCIQWPQIPLLSMYPIKIHASNIHTIKFTGLLFVIAPDWNSILQRIFVTDSFWCLAKLIQCLRFKNKIKLKKILQRTSKNCHVIIPPSDKLHHSS